MKIETHQHVLELNLKKNLKKLVKTEFQHWNLNSAAEIQKFGSQNNKIGPKHLLYGIVLVNALGRVEKKISKQNKNMLYIVLVNALGKVERKRLYRQIHTVKAKE